MENCALKQGATRSFRDRCYALETGVKFCAVVGIALLVASCATKSRIDTRYGVAASPKKYGAHDSIPKGGGRYQTGKPYTIAGRVYVPKKDARGYSEVGTASWYGPGFHGRKTANGEYFDQNSITAAHTTLPLPCYVRVTNLKNNRSIVVRVNDRGPFAHNRVIDLSQKTAEALDFRHFGTAQVKVEYIGKASLNGSDDHLLLASLSTNGTPAQLKGFQEETMVASLSPVENGDKSPKMALAYTSDPSDESPEKIFLRTGYDDQAEVPIRVKGSALKNASNLSVD